MMKAEKKKLKLTKFITVICLLVVLLGTRPLIIYANLKETSTPIQMSLDVPDTDETDLGKDGTDSDTDGNDSNTDEPDSGETPDNETVLEDENPIENPAVIITVAGIRIQPRSSLYLL